MNRPLEDTLRVGGTILVHGPGLPFARVHQLLTARHGAVEPLDWRAPSQQLASRMAIAQLAAYLARQRCGLILLGHQLQEARRVALSELLRGVGRGRPVACVVALSPDEFPRPEIRNLFGVALSERVVETAGAPS